jgi:hypothetical protein
LPLLIGVGPVEFRPHLLLGLYEGGMLHPRQEPSPPRIVMADQAGCVESRYAVGTRPKYRKSGYKKAEIDGLRNKDGTVEKEGLADLSWNYIKSMTVDQWSTGLGFDGLIHARG